MAGENFGGNHLRVERAAVFIDVAAVGAGVGEDDGAATTAVELVEELWCDGAGGAVGAVDDNGAAVEREAGDGGEEKEDVLHAGGFVDEGRSGLGGEPMAAVGFRFEVAEDLVFDGEFGGVGEFVAVGAEELDAVVGPGIVRGGDDNAGTAVVSAREEGDRGGGDDAGALDHGATGGKAGGEGGVDPA